LQCVSAEDSCAARDFFAQSEISIQHDGRTFCRRELHSVPFAIIKTSLSLQVETLGGEYASFDEARSVLFGTCWNICHDHSFNWISNLIVTLTFLALVQMTGASRTFWLYGLFAIGAWIFSYRLAPETKNRSLEEIEELWRN
jgi:hypothetical protein